MRIQAITRDNGAGLSKDVQVLREALTGHEIDVTPWDRPRRSGRWNWNFHLELVNPSHIPSGTFNALVPNAEWFDGTWIKHLARFDVVLAKTRDCEAIFRPLHRNVVYTGWTSPDPRCEVDYQAPGMVHIAGRSIMKGTPQVIEAMRRVPDLHLDLVMDAPPKGLPDNITPHKRITDEALCALRRKPIHVQPSTYEGFGHVINEGRAMGALIVGTAEGTGCEILSADYAVLCPTGITRRKALAMEQIPDIDALAECMRIASANVAQHGATWGERAKAAYQRERQEFHERINALVKA